MLSSLILFSSFLLSKHCFFSVQTKWSLEKKVLCLFHKTGVKWPKNKRDTEKNLRERKKYNRPINKFVFVAVAPFIRRNEKLTTKISSLKKKNAIEERMKEREK